MGNTYSGDGISPGNRFVAFIFTDVVGSSRLWKANESEMARVLDQHFKLIAHEIGSQGGMVVKTVGDAVMGAFASDTASTGLQRAIIAAYSIQKRMTESNLLVPIGIKKVRMQVRIGVAAGLVNVNQMTIQGKEMLDFFGNVVNIASRMESKVSKPDGFAVALLSPSDEEMVASVLDTAASSGSINYNIISFKDTCDDFSTRSGRLMCRPARELHGVGEVTAISVTLPTIVTI